MRTLLKDTVLYENFVSADETGVMFEGIVNEIDFQQWYHMPSKQSKQSKQSSVKDLVPLKRIKRALAVPDEEGNIPYYRFTVNDQAKHGIMTPMTPTVEKIRQRVSKFCGCEFNHAVVLLYRDGDDSIGYHQDKTLDLDEESPIVSVTLGETRTYSLVDNPRAPTDTLNVDLENGCMVVLGPETNKTYYHAILPSTNPEEIKGQRISLTFRKTQTFKTPDGTLIGKGKDYQTLNWPIELRGIHIETN